MFLTYHGKWLDQRFILHVKQQKFPHTKINMLPSEMAENGDILNLFMIVKNVVQIDLNYDLWEND